MRTIFKYVLFGKIAGGIDLDIRLSKESSGDAVRECVCDDCNDDVLGIEMTQFAYVLRLVRIGGNADTRIGKRLTEIDLQRPARRDRHTAGDDIDLTLLQRGYELLELIQRDHGLDSHVRGYFFSDLDFEANQFAGLCLYRPRYEFCNSDSNRTPVENVGEHIGIS